jgi:hypothetical protein
MMAASAGHAPTITIAPNSLHAARKGLQKSVMRIEGVFTDIILGLKLTVNEVII